MLDKTARRREFIAAGLPAAAASSLRGAQRASGPRAAELPSVRIGDKTISRLVAGSNPISGYSYGTPKLDRHMLEYFTVERITEFILRCERQGITTWQSNYNPRVRDGLRAARERGSRIQWILLTSESQGNLQEAMALKPIAVCHHGGVSDRLTRSGKQEAIHDFVKRVHDLGAMAGISTHNPDFLAKFEDAGWENDFYMACFYYLTRTPEERRRILSEDLWGPYIFVRSDPQRMAARIREVSKPCLAYKILAAGHACRDAAAVDRAFSFAFGNIKPTDGVIVGMYPVFTDEIGEDAELTRKYGVPGRAPAT